MTALDILYQDDGLVAVDKPAGILVHQARIPEPSDQIAMKILRDQLGKKIFTIHRLDRPTSGVLLYAIKESSLRLVHDLFENREVTKKYIAVVHGETPLEWYADTPLARSDQELPREARTDFKRLAYRPSGSFDTAPELAVSIVEAIPHTGRYHQIRQHLQLAGHPIVGDYLYGDIEQNNSVAEKTGVKRMMLMSNELHFIHPESGQPVEIKAPFPSEFRYFQEAE
jgi:tRNA pseudouridine65 synthase